MIPETPWPVRELLEVASISSGGTPSKSRSEYWEGGNVPWITARDMKTVRIGRTSSMLTPAGAGAARLMPPGTVFVLTRGMTLFRDLPVVLNIQTAAFNQDVKALTPSADLDAEFLAAVLTQRKSELLQHVSTAGHGTGRLDTQRLELFPVPVPPLSEQRKIAEILGAWDEAIEHAETLVRAETQAFGVLRRRLFVSCGHEVPLSEVSTRITTKSDGSSHTVMTISAKKGFVAQADKYRRDMAGASLANYTLLRHGEFAYNKGNSLTYPQGCIYALKADSALVPNVYYSFRLRSDLNSSYYEHFFASGELNRQLAQKITSGVRGNGLLNLNADDFFSVKVPVPNRATQDGTADALETGARKIELLQLKAELLRTQKRGLMQKLLTGQLRVDVAAGIEQGRPDDD